MTINDSRWGVSRRGVLGYGAAATVSGLFAPAIACA
ncbi:twin-arginine translocation signal domain-containing protein [uncultured Roseovarius sp.]|nr:twin-arginine translocation signal domain-containing protein [uncultured Roseovarius sp.]